MGVFIALPVTSAITVDSKSGLPIFAALKKEQDFLISQKTSSTIFHQTTPKKDQKRVKKALKNVVRIVSHNLDKFSDERLRQIFFHTVSCFGEVVGQISLNKKLKRRLIQIICKDDPKMRNASKTAKEAKLALHLGFVPKKNKGAYESLIFKNLKGKATAIFKAGKKGSCSSLAKRIENWIKKLFRIPRQKQFLFLADAPFIRIMVCERASYLLDEVLNTKMVPQTEITYMNGQKGSFQKFVDDKFVEAQDVQIPTRATADSRDYTLFQKMAVIDYLMGNLDRKSDNWLVKMTNDGHMQDVRLIDNGNCLPFKHPRRKATFSSLNTYAWRSYDIAEQTFRPEISRHFLQLLSQSTLERIFSAWEKEFSAEIKKHLLSTEVKQKMNERLQVLRLVLQKGSSPKELASYDNQEAIDNFLASHS